MRVLLLCVCTTTWMLSVHVSDGHRNRPTPREAGHGPGPGPRTRTRRPAEERRRHAGLVRPEPPGKRRWGMCADPPAGLKTTTCVKRRCPPGCRGAPWCPKGVCAVPKATPPPANQLAPPAWLSPESEDSGPNIAANFSTGAAKTTFLSLREAQAVLMKKMAAGRRDKMAAVLMKHIEKAKKKPDVRTSFSGAGADTAAVVCRLLCKNGGVCLLKDRCLCPSNFTGKFCQIPVLSQPSSRAPPSSSSSALNEVVKPPRLSVMAANAELTRSEFLLPLGGQNQDLAAGSAGASLVKVSVQHPPEASVKVHQVTEVSGMVPAPRPLSSLSGSAGAPAPVRGDDIYAQHAGFKYCFREVKDGQCSSPLSGLRSKEMCCRGPGKAWGSTQCALCPPHAGPNNNNSCPVGFQPGNGTKCLDVNECLQPGLCDNGLCVNTAGSFSCVCKRGFILDASHGLCISQSVISQEKGQCHRVLGWGRGPSSCSLPILRNITKQICCCSRVGKAWGPQCQRCPDFGSAAFKEICPAGPGYHYSASALQFSQRAADQLGARGAQLVTNGDKQHQDAATSSGANKSRQKPAAGLPSPPPPRPAVSLPPSRPVNAGNAPRQEPQTPDRTGAQPSRPRPTAYSIRPPQQSGGGQSIDRNQGNFGTRDTSQSRGIVGNQGSSQSRNTSRSQSSSQKQDTSRNLGTNQNQGTIRSQDTTRNQVSSQNPRISQNQGMAKNEGSSQNQDATRNQGISQNRGTSRNQTSSQSQSAPQNRDTVRPQVTSQNQGISRSQIPNGKQTNSGRQTTRVGGSTQISGGSQGTNQYQGSGRGQVTNQNQGSSRNQGGNDGSTQNQETSRSPSTGQTQGLVAGRGESFPGPAPSIPKRDSSPGGDLPPLKRPQTTTQPPRVHYVNECVVSGGVCDPGECVNTGAGYRCICPPGYKTTPRKTSCDDVDECEDPLVCPGQECVNSPGSYRCISCQPGFGLLNGLCTDIDECVGAPCSDGTCVNTPGSFRCLCRHGYKLHNFTCADVDECADPSRCPGRMCVNSAGSYRCAPCRPGYALTDKHCTDVNECEDGGVCPGGQCVNTEGSYKCVDCRQGYRSVNGLCEDVDECASASACEAARVCVNTVGSFRCDCLPGYRTFGWGPACRDIDECLEENWCPPAGECVNTPGSYKCLCPQGYALGGDKKTCVDVNECARPDVCADGDCLNTDGSFACKCRRGFAGNPEGDACLDVDECVSSGGSLCRDSERCENTVGSYRCLASCEPGYRASAAGRCEDVNECEDGSACGAHAVCQNVAGTYACVCDRGFAAAPDGNSCVDEDECASAPGVCGSARCRNLDGSFECECDTPGEKFQADGGRCASALQPETPPVRSPSSSLRTGSPGLETPAAPPPALPALPAPRPGELRDCYYNLDSSCNLLAANSTLQECCCTLGGGWGLGCVYRACPPAHAAEFLSLCPSGRGYVTTGAATFSYTDVDECKRFHPEVCKNGVCVNNIPGYHCYCSSGFFYSAALLECVDVDECELELCGGGSCVNTAGSYYCSCPPPLVLDQTQQNCVNASHHSPDENLSVCWQTVSPDLMCQSPLLGAQVTFGDCCCLYGRGWGMECALCPQSDSEDLSRLCSSFPPAVFPDPLGPQRGGGPAFSSPFIGDAFPPDLFPADSDYDDDFSPAADAFGPPTDDTYGGTGRFEDYDGWRPRPPFRRLSPEPLPEDRADAPPLGPRGSPYEDERDSWGPGPPFPPYAGGDPRRLYERRYDEYAGLSAAEDCGIADGCRNGTCVRTDRGFTCDCYRGYRLDAAAVTCADVNECDGGAAVDFPCVNSRCVNTDGSFRCVCRRGYVMSRWPNRCVPA
ncbi:latent-transforming growth factor beta-binding protein 4-like [Syngnathoides biaculeatus]|uniref:latent-transforming growth factor beta-binding protein 4-like n=1 Tax=Syngnathoides biaculeatus TaxID=300417 RepID=UPI002ADE91D5|nr:latent-transforming growth factor beta-binding protein 4-like [Syngnathoides biaculeatus]